MNDSNEACLQEASCDLVRTTSYVDRIRVARVSVGWSILGVAVLISAAIVAVGFPWSMTPHAATVLQVALALSTLVLGGLVTAWGTLGHIISDLTHDRNELASEVSSLRLYSVQASLHSDDD
jgi:hypothetical protein